MGEKTAIVSCCIDDERPPDDAVSSTHGLMGTHLLARPSDEEADRLRTSVQPRQDYVRTIKH